MLFEKHPELLDPYSVELWEIYDLVRKKGNGAKTKGIVTYNMPKNYYYFDTNEYTLFLIKKTRILIKELDNDQNTYDLGFFTSGGRRHHCCMNVSTEALVALSNSTVSIKSVLHRDCNPLHNSKVLNFNKKRF